MSALNKTIKPALRRARKNNETLVVEPSKQLFRVVVNNFRQIENETPDEVENEDGEVIVDEQQGLPPQPTGYLKYPTYDWF